MRVALLSKACVVGAYQRKLEELARFPDVELTVLVPPSWRSEQGTLQLERVHTTGYELRTIPILMNGHFHLHFYPTLGRHLRQLRPHVLHVDEEPYNLATFLAVRSACMAGAKTLLFTWQNLLRRYPLPFRKMERYVLSHVGYILAGNAEARDVVMAKGYDGPCRVVPQFGVDPQVYMPTSRGGVTSRPFTIGYVGRLVREKGVDLLLRATAALKGQWRLRILGDGPERGRLVAQARRLGITRRVAFEGLLGSSDMPAFYRELDVLVLPSRTRPNWKEQFGRVLIEAMACGVPVVGSGCGEIPHVIGSAGVVFLEEDADALRAALSRLRADREMRSSFARRGRERVLAHYTQARIAAATHEAYLELWRTDGDPP